MIRAFLAYKVSSIGRVPRQPCNPAQRFCSVAGGRGQRLPVN